MPHAYFQEWSFDIPVSDDDDEGGDFDVFGKVPERDATEPEKKP
jgi:hypothetical protein